MSETISHVFTVRERPVGFQPSRVGGALVAVERGYFPVSPTGYRSLAGNFGGRDGDPASIPATFLETLALAQDRDRRALLTQLARAPRPEADALSNFITVSGRVAEAMQAGFFAPEAERIALWRGAYRLLCLIDADRRFQPVSTAPAWTPEACAASLESERELLRYVRTLATGDFSSRPPGLYLGVSAYFDLPPKPTGESPFALPAITDELALGVPPAPPSADEEIEPDAVTALPSASATEDTNQLTLF